MKRGVVAGGIIALLLLSGFIVPTSREYFASVFLRFLKHDSFEQVGLLSSLLGLFGGFAFLGRVFGLREAEALRRQRDAAMDQVWAVEKQARALQGQLGRCEGDVEVLRHQLPETILEDFREAKRDGRTNEEIIRALDRGASALVSPLGAICRELSAAILERGGPDDPDIASHYLEIAKLLCPHPGDQSASRSVREFRAAARFSVGRYKVKDPATGFEAFSPEHDVALHVEELRKRAYDCMNAGDYRTGERLTQQARSELETAGLSRTRVWFATRFDCAQMLSGAGMCEAALDEVEEALALTVDSLDADDEIIAHLQHVRAEALYDLGRLKESTSAFREVVQRRLLLHGKDAPETLNSQHYLARALRATGAHDEALAAASSVLENRMRVLGKSHKHTLNTEFLALELERSNSSGSDFLKKIDDLLDRTAKLLSAQHPDVLAIRSFRADYLSDHGDILGAIRELRAIVPIFRQVMGPAHPYTKQCISNLKRLERARK